MRISTSQFFHQGVTSMLDKQADIAKTQQQLATGERIITPSDDPLAATQVMRLDQAIDVTEQYQRNADVADARLGLEETVLAEVGDILQRVRELAVQANNDTLNADDRRTIAIEVEELQQGLMQQANTRDANGEYLFAGFQTGTEPFTTNGSGTFNFLGDQGQRVLQIGANRQVASGDSGEDIFMRVSDGAGGISSVFDTLYEFSTDLRADNPSQITLTKLDAALEQVRSSRSAVGSRMNSIENQRSVNDSFKLLLQENVSDLRDIDYAEAVSRFEQQLMALQASQQTFIKIEGLSLFNYIR